MERIRTQFSLDLPPERVYEAISHVENIPLYAPGIEEARSIGAQAMEAPGGELPAAIAGLLDLVTRSGRHLQARVVEDQPERRWILEDENGTQARWELIETSDGTLATYTLEGEFGAEAAPLIRSEVRAKVARLMIELGKAGPET